MEGAEKRRLKPSNRRAEFSLCFCVCMTVLKRLCWSPGRDKVSLGKLRLSGDCIYISCMKLWLFYTHCCFKMGRYLWSTRGHRDKLLTLDDSTPHYFHSLSLVPRHNALRFYDIRRENGCRDILFFHLGNGFHPIA